MKELFRAVAVTIVISALAGCASGGLDRDEYYERLRGISLGVEKNDFLQTFPEAIPRGARQYPNGTVEVMELSYEYYAFMPTGNTNRNEITGMEAQLQWFYFYNDTLIQYGNPNDWPQNPDIIIESRAR